MNVNVIKYNIEDNSNFTRYIFDFILNIIGLVGKETNSGNVDIYYGNKQTPSNCKILIKKMNQILYGENLLGER